MKKFFVAALITITTLASTFYGVNQNVTNTNSVAIASAAVSSIQSKQPSISLYKRTATTATLNISKVSGAKGYKIYRSSSKNGTYKYVGATKTTTFKDKGLSYGKSYYYIVRAYVVEGGTKIHSKYSEKLYVYSTFSKVTNLKATQKSSNSLKLNWDSVNGADKYKVYRSSSLNGTYNFVGITNNTYYTDSSLSNGSNYYYLVRAYSRIGGSKYNGVFSDKLSVTLEMGNNDVTTPTPTPSTPDTDNNGSSTSSNSFANEVLVLVNKERAEAGLSGLSMSSILLPPANTRAKEIKQVFSHTRPDGSSWSTVLSDYNISVQAAGENLAYGYNTPEAVVTGWMNSPGHRANILNSNFNNIGIGVYTDSNGTVYCTQLFSN